MSWMAVLIAVFMTLGLRRQTRPDPAPLVILLMATATLGLVWLLPIATR
jgi:hypothetical protein